MTGEKMLNYILNRFIKTYSNMNFRRIHDCIYIENTDNSYYSTILILSYNRKKNNITMKFPQEIRIHRTCGYLLQVGVQSTTKHWVPGIEVQSMNCYNVDIKDLDCLVDNFFSGVIQKLKKKYEAIQKDFE